MAILYNNDASALLASAIDLVQTSIVVTTGFGVLFPLPTGGDYFVLVIEDVAGNLERMKCTARSVDTLTVERGFDGSSPFAFAAGARVEIRPIAHTELNKLQKTGDTATGQIKGITPVNPEDFTRKDYTDNLVSNTTPVKSVGNIGNPLLNLPLENSLAFSEGVGSILFGRASTATYMDRYGVLQYAAVDEPRFEKAGLLLEGASTNLVTYSEQFDNAAWTKTNSSITANVIDAPDGTLTADKIYATDATVDQKRISQGGAIAAGSTITISSYVKADEVTKCNLLAFSGADEARTYFDLTTGSKGTSTTVGVATVNGYGIEAIVNGWYRIWMTCYINAISTSIAMGVQLVSTDGDILYTGSSGDGFYAWGAQFEELEITTSYIPTVATAVSRSIDICGVTFKNNHPKLEDGTELSLLVDAQLHAGILSTERIIYSGGYQGGIARYSLLRMNSGSNAVFYYRGASGDLVNNTGISNLDRYGITINALKLVTTYLNGVQITANTRALASPSNPLTTTIGIGCTTTGISSIYGHISNLRIYNKALTDAEMRIA